MYIIFVCSLSPKLFLHSNLLDLEKLALLRDLQSQKFLSCTNLSGTCNLFQGWYSSRGTRWRSWLRSRVRFPMVSLEFFIAIWHYGPEVDSVSKGNEYQEYFLGCKGGRCEGLTILPPSCADYLEIWEPQHSGTHWACPGLEWDCFACT